MRSLTIDNEPWFILGDVMTVLELNTNDSNKIKKRLDQADQNTTLVSDGVQNRRATIINESGLYDVNTLTINEGISPAKKRLDQQDCNTTAVLAADGKR